MNAARVDAIIVNYRTPHLTLSTVKRLRESSLEDISLTVTVVENGSGDDSVEIFRDGLKDATLLVSAHNLGFAGGNNLALTSILADRTVRSPTVPHYMLLLNSDVDVADDTVATLARYLTEHSHCAIVGPKIVLPNGKLDLACRRGFPTPSRAFWKLTGISRMFPSNPRFTGYNLTHLPENTTCAVDSVVGACMMLRVAAIEQVGLLDERFFMYGEDLDWAYRFKRSGWQVVYLPTTTVVHQKGASSRKQSERMIREFYRAMWLFHRKHYAPRSLFLLNWLVLAGIVARGTIALLANAVRPVTAKRVS